MKKFIFIMVCILFIHRLAFAEYATFNKIANSLSPDVLKLNQKEKEVKLRNDLMLDSYTLNQYSDNETESSSARKAGAIFLYAGLAAASAGLAFLAGSEASVFNKKSYRKTGLILLGAGGGMILVGFILRKVSANKRSFIELNLNPFQERLEIRYQINF